MWCHSAWFFYLGHQDMVRHSSLAGDRMEQLEARMSPDFDVGPSSSRRTSVDGGSPGWVFCSITPRSEFYYWSGPMFLAVPLHAAPAESAAPGWVHTWVAFPRAYCVRFEIAFGARAFPLCTSAPHASCAAGCSACLQWHAAIIGSTPVASLCSYCIRAGPSQACHWCAMLLEGLTTARHVAQPATSLPVESAPETTETFMVRMVTTQVLLQQRGRGTKG